MSSLLHHTIKLGRTGFHHLSGPLTFLNNPGHGPGPLVKCARGIPAVDKHRPPWASGSVGLKRLARRDVAVGAHCWSS
jgi:hypothetical protein